MFCPNCGTDNPDKSRFCLRCANLLGVGISEYDSPIRSSDPDDSIPYIEFREDEQVSIPAASPMVETDFGSSSKVAGPPERNPANDDSNNLEPGIVEEQEEAVFWPAEVVFVPTSDEVVEDEGPVELPHFEDAQADDVFEQSLSGLVLADLGPADSSLSEDPETDEIETRQLSEDTPEEGTVFDTEDEAKRSFLESNQPVDRRKWPNTLFRVGAISAMVAVAFAAGVGTGIWVVPKPLLVQEPKPEVITSAETKTPEPLPPPGMAYVPGGEFVMGSDTDDEFSRPSHAVTVQPFFVDLTEVMNEEYLRFVTATGHRTPKGWKNGTFPVGEGRFPVTGVSWFDAADYAEWVGKRLPTEKEWEFAARGTDGRIYPWGNDWNPNLANADHRSGGLREVGEGGTSPFGLFDMSGNAWEWTASDATPFPGGKAFLKSPLELKIIRGGNWQSDSTKATTVFRGYYGASGEAEYNGTGFRCVKDISRD